MESLPLNEQTLKAQDVVLIATDHTKVDYAWVVQNSSLVLDTRNATRNVRVGLDKVVRA
jgi:UDP-N-acetyl-D-glucosamine dehydrogenase